MIVGHESQRDQLEQALPPVTLLLGPESVGKMTLARHLAVLHAPSQLDRLQLDRLTVDGAREISQWTRGRPQGALRVILLRLDAAVSEAALNALLKELEEAPPHVRFILVSAVSPLLTIMSRSQVHRLGVLSDDEVARVLHETAGMDEATAARQAKHARGRVRPALAAGEFGKARAKVLSVLKAIADRDHSLLDRALRSWDADAHYLLWDWLTEAATGRWHIFTPADGSGLAKSDARALIARLSAAGESRSRLALQAAAGAHIRLRR